MATKASIANLALTHCGISGTIVALDTDNSAPGKAIRRVYGDALRYCLADVAPGFARVRDSLAALDVTAPVDWTYVYAAPAESLKMIGLFDELTYQQREDEFAPWERGMLPDGTEVIYANVTPAYAAYITENEDATTYDHAFTTMLSYYIAHLVCYELTQKANLKQMLIEQYERELRKSKATDKNAAQRHPQPLPSALAARG